MSEDHLVDRARLRIGSTLRHKWRLDQLLGVGGMAAVYAATHRNGKRVAVKMLHAELALNPDVKTRFLREGYVANQVEHPGALSVLDDDEDEDGAVFLVMDLLQGETIEERWERKGRLLDPSEVLSIADKLLDVLAAAHDKGIVHRDIKPENVFLTRDGQVKILDFGIARLIELANPPQTRTRIGHAMGTPAFMPPEQAMGDWDAVDARSDLWALGALMFTAISGRHVHEARNLNEQLVAAATKPAGPLLNVAPHVPRAVAEFVDRTLSFNKTDRWDDARVMQCALRRTYYSMETGRTPSKLQNELPPVDRDISVLVRVADQLDDGEDFVVGASKSRMAAAKASSESMPDVSNAVSEAEIVHNCESAHNLSSRDHQDPSGSGGELPPSESTMCLSRDELDELRHAGTPSTSPRIRLPSTAVRTPGGAGETHPPPDSLPSTLVEDAEEESVVHYMSPEERESIRNLALVPSKRRIPADPRPSSATMLGLTRGAVAATSGSRRFGTPALIGFACVVALGVAATAMRGSREAPLPSASRPSFGSFPLASASPVRAEDRPASNISANLTARPTSRGPDGGGVGADMTPE